MVCSVERFTVEGRRVPLIGPQGIFKPALPRREFVEERYELFRKTG